ncbi:MAG: host attachment family protein [Pseudomonadota bacterium]
MRLETGTLVLISDAAKALLLENKGDAHALDLRVVEVLEDKNPPTRDQGTDRPGRFNTPAGGQATAGETDWHEAGEDRFLARVAELTLKAVSARSPANLVLAADPRALGKLRRMLADSGSITLIAEINRDLAHQTLPNIEEAIARA